MFCTHKTDTGTHDGVPEVDPPNLELNAICELVLLFRLIRLSVKPARNAPGTKL